MIEGVFLRGLHKVTFAPPSKEAGGGFSLYLRMPTLIWDGIFAVW